MNQATYRFLRVKAGIAHFAKVSVDVSTTGSRDEVQVALHEADASAGEASVSTAPDWVNSAVAGAERVLRLTSKMRRQGTHAKVSITKIVGSPVDTQEDSVEVAATIATAHALGFADMVEDVLWVAERWRVELKSD